MAANNVTKFVRSNLNLKPWILSKNSKDIVNSYVQKLYKQISDDHRNDLSKLRIDGLTPEAPMRSLKTPNRFPFPTSTKPKSKLRSNGYHSPPMTAKNSFVTAPKKLIKSPTFKIYSTRKFGSSASSSNASFLRGNYEERRKRMYKPAYGMQFRTFTGSAAIPMANFHNSPGLAKYIAPTRLYNELSNQLKTVEITNTICKDLMSVNESIKQKIRVINPKTPVSEPNQMTSFKGWNHPSIKQMYEFTDAPVYQKSPTTKKSVRDRDFFSVAQIKQKAHGGKVSQVNGLSSRRENVRHQVAYEMPCYDVAKSAYSYYLKSSEMSDNMRVEQTNQQAQRFPVESACGNRTVRTVRGCYPRSSKKVSQSFRKS